MLSLLSLLHSRVVPQRDERVLLARCDLRLVHVARFNRFGHFMARSMLLFLKVR
jgi:hypothetical protein